MSKNVKTQTPQSGIGPRRGNMFAETEYAKDISWTLKRIGLYFVKEKKLIFGMLTAVLGGTLAGIYAPMLQSNAVDIIAGQRSGDLKTTIAFMLATYLMISLLRMAQGVFSAKLSLRIVRQFREELFGKVIDLPVKYTDTHSHGDVMSRYRFPGPALFVQRCADHHRHGCHHALALLAVGPVKLRHHLPHRNRHPSVIVLCPQIFQRAADLIGQYERNRGRNRQRVPHGCRLQSAG